MKDVRTKSKKITPATL